MSLPRKIIAIGAVVIVALVGAGVWWFLRDDAPAEASLATAVESVEEGTATTEASETTDDGASAVAGTWTVDTETGDFTYESATGTFAGFRIDEELAAIGSTTAVGRTDAVSGEVTIEGTTVTAASFEVDLTTITTETSMRDRVVQDALETEAFPSATFALTEPVELGEAAATGEAIEVVVAGELTIHGVTRPAEIAVEAQLVEGTVVLVATTEVTFADHDVEVPSSPAVLSVDDHGVLEAQILLVR
ncbi:YceI family protein [Iamia sp. SCSIO 61187]|uniref:YceI family protein n=1 Tax=Iamia sp. SCSIO 61187 TaxID=2722752 RepID=UPI001C627B02|nr:YceI family protein [Iamia sp. SCSIO 61187]QYG92233.1 YceI family protein [Iamia sp. SCSIO 61187]